MARQTKQVNKKKILFIVEAMGGGVFTYIVDLANELARMKTSDGVDCVNGADGADGEYIYDMYVAYGLRKQTPKDYKSYFDPAIHLIKVESFERSINPAKDVKAFFEIKRIADEVQPDIIHLHSSKAGALGRVVFNGYRIKGDDKNETSGKEVPLFYTPHGYSFLMKNHNAVKRAVYKMVESGCGKLNCTTISCSYGEHQESLKLNKRAVYVDNGINVEELKKELQGRKQIQESTGLYSAEVADYPFTVFTLGRICYQKNPKLFNQIAEKLPDVKFLWIGDGELREELKSKNIEISGWADRKTVLTMAAEGDVFLLTSLWEGLPISLLEAMYMKKPCVVSDVIGNHDVIHSGENGFVCRDVDEFINAICSIQRDMSGQSFEDESGEASVFPKAVVRGETEKLVKKAYEEVMEKYNTKVMVEKYRKIYCNS